MNEGGSVLPVGSQEGRPSRSVEAGELRHLASLLEAQIRASDRLRAQTEAGLGMLGALLVLVPAIVGALVSTSSDLIVGAVGTVSIALAVVMAAYVPVYTRWLGGKQALAERVDHGLDLAKGLRRSVERSGTAG
jgi:uncharacterized membrane protein